MGVSTPQYRMQTLVQNTDGPTGGGSDPALLTVGKLDWDLSDYPFHMVQVTAMASGTFTAAWLPIGMSPTGTTNWDTVATSLTDRHVWNGTSGFSYARPNALAAGFSCMFTNVSGTAKMTVWSWGNWAAVSGF